MQNVVYKKPETIKDDFNFSFCPGCDHGVALKLIAEVVDELGIRENTIAVASVGCSIFLDDYMNLDIVEAAHGRAMAVATGVKRSKPDKIVFTYQGDGDFASIGIGESIHAFTRGEKVTAICINNTTYGMTGGQAGPTTLVGQVTTTSPNGRNVEKYGYPLKISEIISQVDGAAYVERVMLGSPQNILNTKKAIKKAFQAQLEGLGTGFVEILATCPTNWKMTPSQAHEHVKNTVSKTFIPAIYKSKLEGGNNGL